MRDAVRGREGGDGNLATPPLHRRLPLQSHSRGIHCGGPPPLGAKRLPPTDRHAPVVQADETGWRSNGQSAWSWCFRDPRLALFLIARHRSRAVIERVLGASFAGTLVSDFYAAYHGAC